MLAAVLMVTVMQTKRQKEGPQTSSELHPADSSKQEQHTEVSILVCGGMHNYTLLQEDSSSESSKEETEKKLTQDKEDEVFQDKDDTEVCTHLYACACISMHLYASLCMCMHLYASVCIENSSVLYHHCVGSIARARSLSQVW